LPTVIIRRMDNTTFVKITNATIYEKLCSIEKMAQATNGKVKLNRWIATTALTLCFALGGVVITCLVK